MPIKDLEIFARTVVQDRATGTEQVRDLLSTETEKGWLNLDTPSTQQLNAMFKSLSQYAKASPFSPDLILSSDPVPTTALEWVDGGNINQATSPELFAHYGATFPTLQASAPAGWKYIVRNQ